MRALFLPIFHENIGKFTQNNTKPLGQQRNKKTFALMPCRTRTTAGIMHIYGLLAKPLT